MNYPHYKEIELPLLSYIYQNGGNVAAKQCYSPLGRYFGLAEADMARTFNELQGHGGDRPKWRNMVQWARNALAKEGLISRPTKDNRGHWKLTGSGFAKAARNAVTKLPIVYPDEVSNTVIEGAKKKVIVNRYERRATARDACLDRWRMRCIVCDFDFLTYYGERGRDFIHVHHLKPLSEIKDAYELNPVEDLRPVCPNCHAMIHRTDPACSIAELKNMT
jgi:5-methylcytosine-specific restriction enzyme A